MKLRILAVLSTIALAFGVSVATAHAAAPRPPILSLSSGLVTVHTSNGEAWKFDVSMSQGDQHDAEVDIYRTATGGSESHYWYLPVPKSSLTWNGTRGRAVFKTPQTVASLLTINMTFTKTARHNVTCATGSRTDYTGNLSGRATLNTHLKGGGTIGGRQLTFKAGSTTLSVDRGCIQLYTPTCADSTYFNAYNSNAPSLYGYKGGGTQNIQVERNVSLARPAGAVRGDDASARSSHAPVLHTATKTLDVFGSASGFVTGSGHLVVTQLDATTQTCKLNGVRHTQHDENGSGGQFENTGGSPIVGHTSLTGRIVMSNGGDPNFDVSHWS